MTAGQVRSGGLGLIELLVGMAVMAIALAYVLPSFSDWFRNTRVRNAALALQGGLQFAQAEAARRNQLVRFQFTDTQDASCKLSTSGANWVVSLSVADSSGGSTSPAGACAQAVSDTTPPYVLQISPTLPSSSTLALSAGRALIGFDGLGRLNSLGGLTTITGLTVNVGSSDGSCAAAGGTVRCLRVTVSPAGEIALCDPARSDSSDPMACVTTSN
jgi:type IV fimbrial biogenesis protein FimT